MSGTVKRVAVRLALEGADQVRTQMTAVGESGQRSLVNIQQAADASAGRFGNLRNVVGQAGFQLQDFAVQVQSGTSALTALSQQGSQFLGVFGTAGAAAGAILTVGILVTQILRGGDATKAWTDALKAQQDAFKNATDAAQSWRNGLASEAERVVQLRDYYQQLSTERQQFELRAANRDQQTLARRETDLRNEIERALGGIVGSFQSSLTAARDAANAYPRGSAERSAMEDFIANDRDLARMRDAIGALERFRSEGSLTTDALATLTVTLRSLAEGNDNVSQRLRTATGAMEQQGGPVRELEQAQQQLNERLAALGASAGGAADRLGELQRRIVLLRQTTLNNPTGGLDAEIARIEERAGALARGGLPLFEGVQSLQQQQDAARRYAEQAEREFRSGLSGMGADQIEAQVERNRVQFIERGMARAAQEAALAAAVEQARERQREAERDARSGARGAAREQRREEREAERELNNALRERESVLRSLETPYDTYIRRLQELAELQDRLPENERLTNDQLQRATDRLQQDLERAERGTERVDDTARQLGLTFSSAFEDAIIKGEDFRTVLKGIEADIARIIIRKAITEPMANAFNGIDFGKIFTSIFSGSSGGGVKTVAANGQVFLGGNVVPFARGGIFDTPTFFPMAGGGTGLMGEAGPEAIMPLRRDASGRLGVAAQGGGGNSMSFSINIDARGADAGVEQRIRVGMAMAVQEAQRQFAANINRGGSAAKTVGRRA